MLLSGLSPTAWEFMLACYCEYHVIRIAMCCGSLRSRITRLHCPCQASVSGHFPLQKKIPDNQQSRYLLTFTKNLRRLPSYEGTLVLYCMKKDQSNHLFLTSSCVEITVATDSCLETRAERPEFSDWIEHNFVYLVDGGRHR